MYLSYYKVSSFKKLRSISILKKNLKVAILAINDQFLVDFSLVYLVDFLWFCENLGYLNFGT